MTNGIFPSFSRVGPRNVGGQRPISNRFGVHNHVIALSDRNRAHSRRWCPSERRNQGKWSVQKAPGQGTEPTTLLTFQGDFVGRVPSRGEPRVFQRPATDGVDKGENK